MSKSSHAVAWPPDAPTPAQLKEFFAQIEFGRITKDSLQNFLRGLRTIFLDLKVTVDYSRDLSQMIVAGKYDWVNSDITQEHFPINGNGKVEEELVLFHFGKNMSSGAVLAELDRAGYRPARIEELLALGKSQPDLQKQFLIVALDSVWWDQDGRRRVPSLGWSSSERRLCLGCFEDDWYDGCRFAALRK